MSRLRKGLVLALEEMENENLPVEEFDADETRLEADEAVGEVTESEAEIDDMSDTVEEATEDTETLAGIHDTMEESLEDGGEGLSEEAAEIAEVAVEAIYARLGIKHVGRIMPATESFKAPSSRRVATEVAMGDIKQKYETAKAAILKFIQMIKEKITAFFANLLKNATLLEKHIKAVEAKVKTASDDANKPALKLSRVAKELGKGTEANAETAQEKLDSVAELLKHGRAVGEALRAAVRGETAKIPQEAEKISAMNAELGDKLTFLGGLKLKLSEAGSSLFKKITFAKDETPTATELKALSKSEMESLIKECLKMVIFIKEYKAVEKANNEMLKELDKKVKDLGKDSKEGEEDSAELAILKKVSTDSGDIIAKTSVNFSSIAFQTVNSVLKYIEASIAAKAGEEPAAKEEPAKKEETGKAVEGELV